MNRKMCLDCHELFKAVSKVWRVNPGGRRVSISCRDTARRHVFEAGRCSCGDIAYGAGALAAAAARPDVEGAGGPVAGRPWSLGRGQAQAGVAEQGRPGGGDGGGAVDHVRGAAERPDGEEGRHGGGEHGSH